MTNRLFYLSLATLMLAANGFSEQERVIRVQNHLRFGFDDNLYLNEAEEESAEVMDILNISGKLNFSSRTDAVFSYQPEVRYRFDGDPKTITFHDAYGRLNHALSQRAFLTISDRMRYQIRDAQDGAVTQTDANYLNNDLMGALDFSLSSITQLKLGGGYEFRTWDDDNYGETLGNNYDQYKASVSVFRELQRDVTRGMFGVDYLNNEYEGSRGSLDYVTLMAGADHNFNPYMTGFGRLGASMSSVDNAGGSEDSTTPYLDAGIDYNPTKRTSFNANAGYSIYRSQNSLYNSQERFNLGVGVRHDITAKISIASSLSYIMSTYDGSVSINGATFGLDSEDEFLKWNVRGSYQVNRNNFIELGYEFTDRTVDTGVLPEWQRNRFDIGWRLRL